MNPDDNQKRLSELVALLCDHLISDEQFKELDEILQRSSEARRWYHVYMGLHHDLESKQVQEINILQEPFQKDANANKVVKRNRNRLVMTVGVLAACVVLFLVGHKLQINRPSVEISEAVATLTYSKNVQWESDKIDLNSSISPGRLRIKTGLIRLKFRNGVVLTLIGPADFDIRSTTHSILHQGQLAAYVPPGSEGFQVDSPNAKVVDLGTEFGMTVDDHGDTRVSVFDGKVELTPALPNADKKIVSSGHGYLIADKGRAVRLFELAPYKEARDALRGWQTIWEPFGPGSPTGPYPGTIGAAWQSPWKIDTPQGVLSKKRTGVFKKRPLHPGTEFDLSLRARSKKGKSQVNIRASRIFGSIDQFTTSKPYTIEMLIRFESPLDEMDRFSLCSKPAFANEDDPVCWQLDTVRSLPNEEIAWQVPHREGNQLINHSLPVKWWTTYRCFVEIDPLRKTWRAAVASQEESVSNSLQDEVPLLNSAEGPMTLEFEAVSKNGKPVCFSIDAIRIQNRPDTKQLPSNKIHN